MAVLPITLYNLCKGKQIMSLMIPYTGQIESKSLSLYNKMDDFTAVDVTMVRL